MNIAIIFAGGSGERMGAGVPKQFLEINNKPILMHTLKIFEEHHKIDKIYLAVLGDYIEYVWALSREYKITKLIDIIPGGSTAQDTIYKTLKRARQDNPGDSIALIHDGVRPFVAYDVISRNIKSVKEKGSAITSIPCYETVLISKDGGQTVDNLPYRKEAYSAQAPQSFYLDDIIGAHEDVRKTNPEYENLVDSCTIMKSLGKDVNLVEGNRGNIKITTPIDVYYFRGLLQYKENEQAFGFGLTDKMRSKIHYYLPKDEDN
ncbi:MAG: 2-C-methyl-D-erythritol 4-phosphate cytidylyltransferase [Lachnospiraceae bacterium]|nr:2-C-methyl-D-erythritol 4-phosphate cytidylyltransferase [Lachnospiraceae bacterium]